MMFFSDVPGSLFGEYLTEEQLKIWCQRIEPRRNNRDHIRYLNLDAAMCLMYEDVVTAKDLVALAVAEDGDNLHTWCNKGVLALKQDPLDMEEAERSALHILELITGKRATLLVVRAKIDFAYWLAETLRSEKDRDRSYRMFESCEEQARSYFELQNHYSYMYMITLLRQVRSLQRFGKPEEWFTRRLNAAVDQLVVLSRSNKEEYRIDTWTWLAELQCIRMKPEYIRAALKRFCAATHLERIDLRVCIDKVLQQVRNSSHGKKLPCRLGKICLDGAYRCLANMEERRYWLKMALKLSEEWIEDNYWVFMCASTSAQSLILIWAMEFYSFNQDLVRTEYSLFYPGDENLGMHQ